MKTKAYGKTVKGRSLEISIFGNPQNNVDLFVFAGVHGDEEEAVVIGKRFLEWCSENEAVLEEKSRSLVLMAEANPDGIAAGERGNGNGVDLNRNMDTKDWSPEATKLRYQPGPSPLSEPESKALKAIVEEWSPREIISLHTFDPCININGPADELGQLLAEMTGYPANHDIGYPTPGSFGTWAGHEREIPTITFEIRRDMPKDSDEWQKCLDALVSVALNEK